MDLSFNGPALWLLCLAPHGIHVSLVKEYNMCSQINLHHTDQVRGSQQQRAAAAAVPPFNSVAQSLRSALESLEFIR